MATPADPSRRTVLAGAGGVGLAAVLAACSSPDTAAESGGDSTAAEASLVPAGEELAAVADVPVGGAVPASVGAVPVLVTQPTDGEIRAFDAVCPHQGCTVQPGDGELECPCHRSRFDLATGEVLGGPSPSPLPEISVTVTQGQVVTT